MYNGRMEDLYFERMLSEYESSLNEGDMTEEEYERLEKEKRFEQQYDAWEATHGDKYYR